MFCIVLLAGIFLVIVQGIFAWTDRYLTQTQMQARGVMNGYSFMEHGGMWSDVVIISPLVAYITTSYHLAYTAWWSGMILVVACAVTTAAGIAYNKIGLRFPVAHSHDGRTTIAGWIHGAFAIAVIWIGGLFYLTPVTPPPSTKAFLGVSALLTPFSFLGIVDFNKKWIFLKGARVQVAVQIILLWAMTVIRLMYR